MAGVELQQIGQYTITQLLHENSACKLYLGRHQQRKKDVAIKAFLTPLSSIEGREAFVLRAKQLKKLKHRNIIEVQDFGLLSLSSDELDHGYLVLQYAPEGNIYNRVVPGQQMEAMEAKRLLSPMADALHYAHINKVVHGNLHPGNLLLGARNETLLSDFSLMLPVLNREERAIPYRAPEYLQGTYSDAGDQYSLAVMVYEWLCGRRPYEATDAESLLRLQEHEPLPAPRDLNPKLSSAVEQVLLQALARNPDERFPHTQAFADAYLRALMGLPVQTAARATSSAVVNTLPSLPQQPSMPPLRNERTPQDTVGAGDHNSLSYDREDRVGEIKGDEVQKAPAGGSMFKLERVASNGKGVGIEVRASAADDVFGDTKIRQSAPRLADPSDLSQVVSADLCRGGILSRSLQGYEERPAQIEMARLVARSLRENVPSIVEASTGTGKSLAYLVPIVRSGKVAIISTANKALQEQLFYKDIPFVQKHIRHFEAALVKGMGNYVCLDRMENERIGIQFYAKNRDFARLLAVIKDAGVGFNGDFETLGFPLGADIRSKVNADSDQCAWSKCDFYPECYVRKMREKARQAQIIVVNHTLLLLDAVLDGHLLPERDVIVIDEAHHLEEEATRCFTTTVSPGQVTTLLAQRMLKAHTPVSQQDDAQQAMVDAWERLAKVADPGAKGRVNLQEPLQEGLRLASMISKLADSLVARRPKELPEKENELYDKLLARTQNLAASIRQVFSVSEVGRYVYYVERVNTSGMRGGRQLEVSAAPLDVTMLLREQLFNKYKVICTSATLATVGPNPVKPEEKGPNFAYFRRRIGLDPVEYPETLERILPLSFDYESNALLYLPRDLPEPAFGTGSADYTKAIAREMFRLVKASRGRAFLLFSSKRMLEDVFRLFNEELLPGDASALELRLLRQGDFPRLDLTRRFREEAGAVLFGLKSFWEGVDIAGEALSLVVIDKLPFDPPDDPVHEARVAQMKAAGENWFGAYVLPQTVLRLKQGLGRLLRTREDRGVMAILDTRLYTKSYGRTILGALPPARRTTSLREVELFFSEEPAPF